MRGSSFERGALVVLSLMLLCVFSASVYMYDEVSEQADDGVLAAFAQNAREFVYENEAVAAFLGISEPESAEEGLDIAAEAAAYIERYNRIYEGNK